MLDFDKITFTPKTWGDVTAIEMKEFLEKRATDFFENNPYVYMGMEFKVNKGWDSAEFKLPYVNDNELPVQYINRILNDNKNDQILEMYNLSLLESFNAKIDEIKKLQEEAIYCLYDTKGYNSFIDSLKEVATPCVAKMILNETLDRYTKRKAQNSM